MFHVTYYYKQTQIFMLFYSDLMFIFDLNKKKKKTNPSRSEN